MQKSEKYLSSSGGSIAFFCLPILLCRRRRTCAKATELQSVLLQVLEKQFDLTDNEFL